MSLELIAHVERKALMVAPEFVRRQNHALLVQKSEALDFNKERSEFFSIPSCLLGFLRLQPNNSSVSGNLNAAPFYRYSVSDKRRHKSFIM